jgi:hypothetical protein
MPKSMEKRTIFFFFLLFVLCNGVLFSQSVVPVSQDSYVRGGSFAGTNFGSASSLEIKTAGNVVEYSRETYLKFDLSAWNPGWVQHAVLFVHASEGSGFHITASLTEDDWTESGLNWTNVPVELAIMDSVLLTGGSKSYSMDISSAFLHEAFGDKTLSIRLADRSNSDKLARFQSLESGLNPPRILVFTGGDTIIESPFLKTAYYDGEAIQIEWEDLSDNETGFVVERKRDEEDFQVLDTSFFNATQFSDFSAVPGFRYTFRIQAINPLAVSAYSEEYIVDLSATTLPSPVESFKAMPLSSGRILLSWDHSEQVSGFLLSKARSGEFQIIDTLDYSRTDYTDKMLNPETEYHYFIQAYNYLGTSTPSDTLSVLTPGSRKYYLDASLGDDDALENSLTTPWKSLDKLNSITFEPGDSILFRSGERWEGQLSPTGSGTHEFPIVVTAYGTGSKPILSGNGAIGAVITLQNVSHWTLSGLEITNPASTEGSRIGVLITADEGEHGGFHLNDLFIHDIFGRYSFEMIGKNTGGIGIIGENNTRFDDILIENCELTDIVRVGIFTNGNKGTRGDRPITNLVIQNNTLTRCAGDGMIIRYAYRPLIQHNLAVENHHVDESLVKYGVAIWVRSTDEAIIQYNRVFDTKGSMDGQAFDADLEAYRTLVQYNYSSNNEGGFMLVYGSSSDAIVRYNISQNDGKKGKHLLDFPVWTTPRGSGIIHNNVFYIGEDIDAVLVDEALSTARLYNNIVINKGNGKLMVRSEGQTATFSHNYLSGYSESETIVNKNAITGESGMVNPGLGEMSFASLEGYKLRAESPCIGSGLPRGEMAGSYWYDGPMTDFWGSEVDIESMDVGAHQYASGSGTGQFDRMAPVEWEVSPVPFADSVQVALRTSVSGEFTITLFDIRGNQLGELFRGPLSPGEHILSLDPVSVMPGNSPGGIYLLQLNAPEAGVLISKPLIKT